jgi:hypothetical protein
MEDIMRAHRRAAAILFATLLLVPASQAVSQDRGSIRTETQERLRSGTDYNTIWNLIGLVGLLGLLGLRKGHDEDSYHPASFE